MKSFARLFLLSATLMLGGCYYFFGDKFSEYVPCPKNTETGDYEINWTSSYCPAGNGAKLIIPKRYSPKCSTHYPVRAGAPLENVMLRISYPDFQPVHKFSSKIADNEMYLHLSPFCSARDMKSDATTQVGPEEYPFHYTSEGIADAEKPFARQKIKVFVDGLYTRKTAAESRNKQN